MIRSYFTLTLFLLLACNALNAQADSAQLLLFNQIYLAAEEAYGMPHELLNGSLFEEKYPDAIRHPYLLNYYTNNGSVLYRGKHYSKLNLRYDIHDQQVLLIYFINDVEYKLHLQKEFVTEFKIESKKFTRKAFDADQDARFYQVLGEDFPTQFLYAWSKDLSNLYANNSDVKIFYPGTKEAFILLDDQLLEFNGNRSLAARFSSTKRSAIKAYYRKHKTDVRHASDYEMEELVSFISTLEK